MANLGVVVGIFLLVIEIRQNQTLLEQDQQLAVLDALTTDIQQFHDWREMLVQDEDILRIWSEGVQGN